MQAHIKAISYYLPIMELSNDLLLEQFPEWTVEKVANKIGIKTRHLSANNETALDMAVSAGELFFNEHTHIKRSQIDFVLLCTQSPDYFLPTTACILQNKLNLSTSCGALDFNLGCSGFVYGLSLAKGLISAKIAQNILLITSETYTKHIHPLDKGNRTIFGDAAAVTLISTDGFAEIGNFCLGTDGRGADNLIVKTGGMRYPDQLGDRHQDADGNVVFDDYLYMNGAEIFNFTLEAVPNLVKQTLINNNINQQDIDLFVFHQANKHMLNFLRKKLRIEEMRFYLCLEKFGNTVSSTIPIALKEALLCGSFYSENKILLAGFGVGYSWGGTVLTLKNE